MLGFSKSPFPFRQRPSRSLLGNKTVVLLILFLLFIPRTATEHYTATEGDDGDDGPQCRNAAEHGRAAGRARRSVSFAKKGCQITILELNANLSKWSHRENTPLARCRVTPVLSMVGVAMTALSDVSSV